MSQHLVQQWQQKAVSISQACRILGFSRSGYYAARQRAAQPRICPLTPVLKAVFADSGRTYGSRRMVARLAQDGHAVGRFQVRRLMRESGLKPVWKRKFVATTDSRHDLPVADNRLNRDFAPVAPNTAWVGDITYIRTRSGWLYLAVVIDLYSRKVVGWAMDRAMPAALVCKALHLAVQQRDPPMGLLVHSDRGSQYASAEYQRLLGDHGLVCSMSRVGNCWDNAVAERFFLNLKMERVWQQDYANQGEAERDIHEYIAGFYNERRLHSTLNYTSPNAFERRAA